MRQEPSTHSLNAIYISYLITPAAVAQQAVAQQTLRPELT